MIAIHNSKQGFHSRWILYCKEQSIPFKIVNCYANDIINQLEDCSALMWHFNQGNPKDILLAKQLLFSLQQMGKKPFPDFNTAWHFDDKLGQKYLLEAVGSNFAPTWVFYDKKEALAWAANTTYPKVFKLRGGAGSQNVRLVQNNAIAQRLINKAFGRGFSNYNSLANVKERIRKYKLGKTNLFDVVKGLIRLIYPPRVTKVLGRETGYIYFQEFYPHNDSDTRIIVIGEKAFALKRMVRKNDFRASGSGLFKYTREEFDENCVLVAFKMTQRLNAQCVAFDFIFDGDKKPVLVEISYGFVKEVYDLCTGYWDINMEWHPGKFNPYGWMVELMQK